MYGPVVGHRGQRGLEGRGGREETVEPPDLLRGMGGDVEYGLKGVGRCSAAGGRGCGKECSSLRSAAGGVHAGGDNIRKGIDLGLGNCAVAGGCGCQRLSGCNVDEIGDSLEGVGDADGIAGTGSDLAGGWIDEAGESVDGSDGGDFVDIDEGIGIERVLAAMERAGPESRHQGKARIVGWGAKAGVAAGGYYIELAGSSGAGVLAGDGEGSICIG